MKLIKFSDWVLKTHQAFILLAVIGLPIVFLVIGSLNAQESEIHYRFLPYGMRPDFQLKFRDITSDAGLITEFPMSKLVEEPIINSIKKIEYYLNFQASVSSPEWDTENIRFQYWIYTSVTDAEWGAYDYLQRNTAGFPHALDLGRSGEIGDNCWYHGSGAHDDIIIFIRSNVLVIVEREFPFDSSIESGFVTTLASLIDTLLIQEPKVQITEMIAIPVIHSVSTFSEDGEEMFRIEATDPNGLTLKYGALCLASSGYNYVNNNLVITKWLYSVEELMSLGVVSIKIKVTNEEYYVASYDYFLKPPR